MAGMDGDANGEGNGAKERVRGHGGMVKGCCAALREGERERKAYRVSLWEQDLGVRVVAFDLCCSSIAPFRGKLLER